jgi:Cd2+/Zn2+-exporting ATPase
MMLQLVLLPLAGWPVFKDGFRTIFRNHRFNMNTLMSIASIGAVVLSETYEAIILLLLFTLSEALESYINDNAREILMEFADLAPKTAIRLNSHGEETVAVEALQPGDVILVRPTDRIPMDGTILAGSSSVNQAPITGESKLIEKTIGDEVISGSINGQGALQVQVSKYAKDNTIQRIIQLVTEAQENKAEQVKYIDRFAASTPHHFRRGSPGCCDTGFFCSSNPSGMLRFLWLASSLTLLITGRLSLCSGDQHSITMSTWSHKTAKAGVIFKGGIYLEGLSNAKAIAFDKTGTLTRGGLLSAR